MITIGGITVLLNYDTINDVGLLLQEGVLGIL